MPIRRPLVRPAIALLAIGLSACGSASSGADSSASDNPLGDLLGWTDNDPVESRRQQLAIEESVASCMREEGFEYQPVDYEAQFSSTETDEDIALYSDPEAYGKKYGYGVVHNYELYEAQYIGQDGDSENGGPQFEDPNQDYVSSLSPDDVNAYYGALYGQQEEAAVEEVAVDESTFDEGEAPVDSEYISPPLEEQGCYGTAQLEVVGEDPSNNPDIQAALNDYFESSQNDPRLDQANADWADCMADPIQEADVPPDMTVEKPDAMYQVMEAKKAIATGQRILPIDPDTHEPIGDFDSEQGYNSYENEDGTGFAFVGEQTPIPDAELERLRSLEIKLWTADWDCQKNAGIQDLNRDLQQEAADDLLAQFPELANGE